MMEGHQHNVEQNLLKRSWSPDGSKVTAGSSDGMVYIWDTTHRNILYKLPGHTGLVNECVFHPTERIIGSCSSEKAEAPGAKKTVITVQYFQRVTQARVTCLRPHGETIAREGTGLARMRQRDLIQWRYISSGEQLRREGIRNEYELLLIGAKEQELDELTCKGTSLSSRRTINFTFCYQLHVQRKCDLNNRQKSSKTISK